MDVADIDRIAVLGAGTMGHGIAEVAALAGFDVTVRDIEADLVEDGLDRIEWSLGKLAEHGQITDEEVDAALDRVEGTGDLAEAVEDADAVIEAIVERMDVKREVFGEVSEHAPDRAVFASNTSSLSITEISEATDRPERFAGMHFFNPPVRMDLVEVIAGQHTDAGTLDLIEDLAEAMDKTPVRVRKDSPGFVVNRVLVPMLNEAAWMVEAGEASIEAVDSTVKYDMGLPMGAFELADQVGNDVSLDVLEYMHDTLGAAYEPCPLLREKVEAGELGVKADAGFYDYDDGGVEVPSGEGEAFVGTRLLAVMANETAKLVGDDVADAATVDEAMRLGAGFPEGPAAMADDAGLEELRDALADRHEETGAARYAPADLLVEYAAEGRGFHGESEGEEAAFEHVRAERDGRVGRLILDRPHRMNTLTPEMLGEIRGALDRFESDGEVRSVLVTGAGDRAFSAGADVQAFASGPEPVEAVELSRAGQRTFERVEECDLPVVAAIDGYALGGGMELAAAADLRVATDRSELGQPEHDLGLIPGWGGTQRLPRIVGEGRAKEIIFTAERYDPGVLADYGFLNEVVERGAFEDRAVELARDLAAGPPIAQRFSKRAIHAGRGDDGAGFEIEAEAFGLLMTTDDLVEGVTAFMSDRDPEFEGK